MDTKTVFIIVLSVWDLALTWLILRLMRHYRHLTKGVKQGNLEKILELLLKEKRLNQESVKAVEKKLVDLEASSQFSFKKMGLVKFNPFSELGGNQSFSLAILDEGNRGLVITSLHGRQTTRVYTKLVEKDTKLSEEEQEAVKKAKKEKK